MDALHRFPPSRVFVITQALFVSEPVPAVVGTAMTGAAAGGCGNLHLFDGAWVEASRAIDLPQSIEEPPPIGTTTASPSFLAFRRQLYVEIGRVWFNTVEYLNRKIRCTQRF